MNAPASPDQPVTVGRREYDKLQADYLALLAQLQAQNIEMASIKAEVLASRADMKELLDLWKTMKGVNSFVVWLSKFLIGAGIITAFFKWGPIK
jgi:hypothetical protein